jgi:hypothetical protein
MAVKGLIKIFLTGHVLSLQKQAEEQLKLEPMNKTQRAIVYVHFISKIIPII